MRDLDLFFSIRRQCLAYSLERLGVCLSESLHRFGYKYYYSGTRVDVINGVYRAVDKSVVELNAIVFSAIRQT